jgi:hypothetical protein
MIEKAMMHNTLLSVILWRASSPPSLQATLTEFFA